MEDQNQLSTIIRDISKTYWEMQKAPILLSALPPLLVREVPNYREHLGKRTLKAFINETSVAGGYKIVEHPTQQARIGVTLADIDYEFPEEPLNPTKTASSENNQQATLAFLRVLATLPDAELDKVVIPTSVLIKLLK